MIQISLVQDCPGRDLNETLLKIEHWCKKAAALHSSALCFPEAFLTGYHPEHAHQKGISKDDLIFEDIANLSQTYQLDLLIGFMEKDTDGLYLTHSLIRSDGSSCFYRKSHLGEKEEQFFQTGNHLPVFSLTCGVKIGFQLCVETHFHEITSTLALRGAEVVFAPHAHPAHRENRKKIWQKYIPARSYDNRVYMACTNLWDGSRYFGGLFVTDPEGNITAESFEQAPSMLTFSVDRTWLSKFRMPNNEKRFRNYLKKRRISLYD